MSTDKMKVIRDLEVNLTIIANIPNASKYNVDSRSYSPYSSTTEAVRTGLFRFLQGENRHKSYDFIEGVVNDAIATIYEYPDYQDYILELISNVRRGINNLIRTYASDPEIHAKYKALNNRISRDHLMRIFGQDDPTLNDPFSFPPPVTDE